jgi:hypothetical protein
LRRKPTRKGERFIEGFDGRGFIFICAEASINLAVLSSTMPKALPVSVADFYGTTVVTTEPCVTLKWQVTGDA